MRVGTTLTAFGLGLAVVFGLGAGLGNLTGPVGPATDPAGPAGHGSAHGTPTVSPTLPAGLAVSQGGYTLQVADTALEGGRFSFTVTGPDGRPLTAYTPTHTKDLHVVVVRRDLTGFQHLHPTQDAAGTWSTPLTLPEPGAYKVFADFAPGGQDKAIVLATDLLVPGDAPAAAPLTASRNAEVDGYTVTVQGDPAPGHESDLSFTVTRDGRPVTDLQPYLGAQGHLVVLRAGDLAYLHTHPQEGLRFAVDVPTAATYRLFLGFRHGDAVHTATFTEVIR